MDNEKLNVPIWEKYSLTIKEAALYFGIGEKKLRKIAEEYMGENFILQNGVRVLIKRKPFEKFLDNISSI